MEDMCNWMPNIWFAFINSHKMNVKCADTINNVIDINSFDFVYFKPWLNSVAITIPNVIPNATIIKNIPIPPYTVDAPLNPFSAIDSMTKNRVTAVPSLNKLSPSNIIVNRFGAPNSLNSARTATGSVDDMIAPNNKATINGIGKPTSGKIRNSDIAIAVADMIKPIIDSNDIDHAFSIILRMFILNADSKINIGKNKKNNNSGVNVNSVKKPNIGFKTGI